MHYNFYRYFDPELGRYTKSDPIGLKGGLNAYGYVGGNPINIADPKGLRRPSRPGGTFPYWTSWGSTSPVRPLEEVPPPPPRPIRPNLGPDSPGQQRPTAQPGNDSLSCPVDPDKKGCKPCIPPVGSIATDVHLVPPKTPHYPINGSHVHWFKMQQSPYPMCKCFWKRNFKKPTPGDTTPDGTIDFVPAGGGGVK